MRLYSPAKIKEILDKYSFNFSKGLGQNFLIDGNIVRKIREKSGISKEDTVLEIGPGFGTLTEELLLNAKEVFAIELDQRLFPILKENFSSYNNLRLIEGDVLKLDLNATLEGKKDVKVVANLPYYITTPIISKFIESKLPIESLTFMVQKEVGDRMVAREGSKDFGSLSLFIQYYSDAEIVAKVPNTSFMPRPKVDSVVVRMKVRDYGEVYKEEKADERSIDEKFLFDLIHAAFNQRRKTILNSMTSNRDLNIDKESLSKVLEDLNIDPKTRAERLSLDEFIAISLKLL